VAAAAPLRPSGVRLVPRLEAPRCRSPTSVQLGGAAGPAAAPSLRLDDAAAPGGDSSSSAATAVSAANQCMLCGGSAQDLPGRRWRTQRRRRHARAFNCMRRGQCDCGVGSRPEAAEVCVCVSRGRRNFEVFTQFWRAPYRKIRYGGSMSAPGPRASARRFLARRVVARRRGAIMGGGVCVKLPTPQSHCPRLTLTTAAATCWCGQGQKHHPPPESATARECNGCNAREK
jgi:hypothetical protein